MNYITAGREPFAPFRFFEEISAIPRGSYHEAAIADYLVAFAEERGLWCRRDALHNVCIKKPGAKGGEGRPAVVLQSHTDMVCEQNSGTGHDFLTQPLDLYIEEGRLRARGTTLGGDNGIGVAYSLAALDSKESAHPPLECVFTSMEEVGLTGALGFDYTLLDGRMMINMDSTPEGGLLVSSAGGCSVVIRLPVTWRAPHADSEMMSLSVRGLLGGHSGCDIEKERANSNKLMGRLLSRLGKAGVPFEVAGIAGGAMENAIPRECDAVICLCKDFVETALRVVAEVEAEAREQFAQSDPGIRVAAAGGNAERTFDKETTQTLVRLLNLLPNGRQSMSVSIPDLVTLSLNQAVVTTGEDCVEIAYSLRGAMGLTLDQLAADLMDLATLLGGDCARKNGYPAWEYRADSPLRDLMLAVYKELRGREGFVQAVHGGVECAVIADMIPDMDIVAIGPDIDGVHTPDEWLDLDSYGRTYEYLMAVLARLAA